MADPLSITLAAITLATAIKDMVELVQSIEESFEKVSRNKRELRSLASELKATVLQLKDFSDRNEETLCEDVETKLAILSLIGDLKCVHDKCCDMFPVVPTTKLGWAKVAVKAWLNRTKIEEDIKNLRNRVDRFHLRFMIFGQLRLTKNIAVIKKQTLEGPKQIQEEIPTVCVSDDSLIKFMGSNARTLSKLPPEIDADFISSNFLSLQINAIDELLKESLINPYPVGEALRVYIPCYSATAPQVFYGEKDLVRQEFTRQSLEIQRSLRNDSQDLSIQVSAWTMIDLSIGLNALELHQEALTTGQWTVALFRMLAKVNPNVYSPYLVCSLENLCRFYKIGGGDIDKSLSTVQEAVKIGRDLVESSASNFAMECLLGSGLLELASVLALKHDNEESLMTAQESVDIHRRVFNEDYKQSPRGVNSSIVMPYAHALNTLSCLFEAVENLEDAYQTAREALDVFFCPMQGFLDRALWEIQVANLLYRISHQNFHDFISLEEAFSFSEQVVAFIRGCATKSLPIYKISLLEAVWQQALILDKLERWDEALVLWRETVEISSHDMDDHADALYNLSDCLRMLKRHDEAASIRMQYVTVCSRNKAKTDAVAHGYYALGVELGFADRWTDGINALQSALSQFRALAFKNPEHTKNIGITLNQLTMNLIHCKEFDQAFNKGHESLKLHESLLKKDSSVLTEYILAIQLNFSATKLADNEQKCVERARYCVVCARNVARLHPTEGNLLFSKALQQLAIVLYRFNRVSEAGIVIQEALEWHEKNTSQEVADVERYICFLNTTDSMFFGQGHFKEAARHIRTSLEAGERLLSDCKTFTLDILESMYRRTRNLFLTGQYTEAVDASKVSIHFVRCCQSEGVSFAGNFLNCLAISAMVFNHHGKSQEALAYIQEALELLHHARITFKDDPYLLLQEVEVLGCLGEILADAGQEAQGLLEGKAAVDRVLGLKSELPWSYLEGPYFSALSIYSIRLAASGDLSSSLDHLVQVRSYYEELIKSRLGDSIYFARVLEAEATICCAAGRLDDGAVALAKLHDLQDRLRIVHPELFWNVELALERQRTAPSTITLIQKLNLKCDHEHQQSPSFRKTKKRNLQIKDK